MRPGAYRRGGPNAPTAAARPRAVVAVVRRGELVGMDNDLHRLVPPCHPAWVPTRAGVELRYGSRAGHRGEGRGA